MSKPTPTPRMPREDVVLRRMLATPPAQHKAATPAKKKPKPAK